MDTLTDDPVPDKPPRRGRVLVIVVVTLAVLVVGAGLAYRPFVQWWILREALARGFQLEFADFSYDRDRYLVMLRKVHVRMIGIPQVDVHCDELEVELYELNPLRIQLTGAVVDVTGSPDELQPLLVSFSKEHAESTRLPLTMKGEFRYGGAEQPLIAFTGEVLSPGDGDISFTGGFRVQDMKLGTLAVRRSKENKVDAGFGLNMSEKPIVNVNLDASAVPFKGSVTFAPQKVDDVCRTFALPVPKGFGGASVEGSLSFVLDGAMPSKPHHGVASFVVNGWVPPHPRELDGIVFGKTTKFNASLELLPDLGEVRFTQATVDAGALHLAGKGNAVRDGASARTKMDLSGNVACSELGASAIGSRMQGFVGDILRGVARATVGGTVNIRVMIDADTKALSNAKVDQAVDIGCRLR